MLAESIAKDLDAGPDDVRPLLIAASMTAAFISVRDRLFEAEAGGEPMATSRRRRSSTRPSSSFARLSRRWARLPAGGTGLAAAPGVTRAAAPARRRASARRQRRTPRVPSSVSAFSRAWPRLSSWSRCSAQQLGDGVMRSRPRSSAPLRRPCTASAESFSAAPGQQVAAAASLGSTAMDRIRSFAHPPAPDHLARDLGELLDVDSAPVVILP